MNVKHCRNKILVTCLDSGKYSLYSAVIHKNSSILNYAYLGEDLKTHLKNKAMAFYGEEDCFRKDNIKIADLEISTDLPNLDQDQLVQSSNRQNMTRFYKRNVDSIPYKNLFEELKIRVKEISYKGDTTEAEEKFLQKHNNLVVISGQPGIGKTTLTKRMIYEMWTSSLFVPEIVFFLQFRKVDYNSTTDLLQFLVQKAYNIKNEKDRKNILKRIEESDNVFILMDGLDEAKINFKDTFTSCDIHSDSLYLAERFIQNLLAGEILPHSKKMITSRPHRITQLHNTDFEPKVLFTIQGLDDEALKQICLNICSENNIRCNKIINYLRAHPDLKSHCHTPVIGIMVMKQLNIKYDAAEKRNEEVLPKNNKNTLTAIFVDALKAWLLKKLDSDQFPIKNIAEFAFEKLNEGQFYFSKDELEEANVANEHWSTFLNTFLNGNQEMYFIHLMWQEFLAAVKLRLYTKKEDYENESSPGNVLSKLNDKNFEAVTTKFLFGLCNKDTLAPLLQKVKMEKGRCKKKERLECAAKLKEFTIKKLKIYRDAEYLSDTLYEDDNDDENDATDDSDYSIDDDIGSSDSAEFSDNVASSENSSNNVGGSNDGVSDILSLYEGSDDGEVLGGDNDSISKENDSHDNVSIDLDDRSYFGTILPILGWIHEMGDSDFSQQAAECLRKTVCIEQQILPSDIPVIMHILRACNANMVLKVVYPRFLGKCFLYFFKELHKALKEKSNIQVSSLL